MEPDTRSTDICIPARDGYGLGASVFRPSRPDGDVVLINSATAVPRSFYRHFASHLAANGFIAITYDYRGIGGSRPADLKGFDASMDDWIFSDMTGALDWTRTEFAPRRLFMVGHSIGGQATGLLDDTSSITAMLTVSAQSGYWGLQGAEQKYVVWLHVHITFPLLVALFGYLPWSRFGASEDLPKSVASDWARWCRHPDYILGDKALPVQRYRQFGAPVLAYSFGDDKWGTSESVDAMMKASPKLERRHVDPAAVGLDSIGHFGYFRPPSAGLWADAVAWFNSQPI